ncbi:MAG TPA: alpha/beta hydrolase, partial [Ktedonobacteraceae bacterium]|nr:alpha/beta hydrolase [Ktedonobacteraceae bacterium]
LTTGAVAVIAAIVTGRRYLRWKQQQRQRLLSASRLLETSRGVVEYQVEGTGPVVLLLHGSPGGYDQGMALAHAIDLNGFTLLSPSRPGYRRTPLSSGETPEAQADLYAAALDALDISQVVVVALSGGGPSALQFVQRYPQRCQALLMLCALSQNYTEEGVYLSLPPVRRLFKHLLEWLIVFDPFLFLLSGLIRRISEEARSVEFIESLFMNSSQTPGYRNDMRQFESLPSYAFQDIALPTLIVHGTADIDVPFRQAKELAAAIPGAQLAAIEGADHLSTLARENAVVAIRSFLQHLIVRQMEKR